jgi:hypothetical protein
MVWVIIQPKDNVAERRKKMHDKLKDLEMAKKRDHKIMITDEAINKVPRIEYKEIESAQYDILWKLAREVLLISKEDNDSDEVAITYSLDNLNEAGEERELVYGVSLGDEHSVDPEEDTTSYHILNGSLQCVVVVLHNHPSLSKLSLQDIGFLLMYRSMKMIVAVTNYGSVYYLVKTNKYDAERAKELYREAYGLYTEAENLKGYQEATEYFLNNCYKAGLLHDNR